MAIRKVEWLFSIGGICLAAAILLDRFVGPGNFVDFLVGLFTGLAIILNIVWLYRQGKNLSD